MHPEHLLKWDIASLLPASFPPNENPSFTLLLRGTPLLWGISCILGSLSVWLECHKVWSMWGRQFQGAHPSSVGSLSTAGTGEQHLDLGWLAQIPTSGKTDLRSCFRETSKHVSSLMSSSSKIKPCSLATAEGSQWPQYLFSFWAPQIVLGKRKMCCIEGRRNCWACSREATQPW